MKKLTSSPIKKRIVDLSRVVFKNKLIAGLVNFDNLLLSVRIIARVEGQYVTFGFHLPKSNTLMRIRIRVTTFNRIYSKMKNIKDKIEKDTPQQK